MEIEQPEVDLDELLLAAGGPSNFSEFCPEEHAEYLIKFVREYNIIPGKSACFQYKDGASTIHLVQERSGPLDTVEVFGSTKEGPVPYRLRFNYKSGTENLVDIQRRVPLDGGGRNVDTTIWPIEL